MSSFADRLKELRKQSKITQKHLAMEIELSERSYQDLEYGKFKPSHDNIIKLADYFNISTDYLLGRSDNPKKQ